MILIRLILGLTFGALLVVLLVFISAAWIIVALFSKKLPLVLRALGYHWARAARELNTWIKTGRRRKTTDEC